MSSVDRAGPVSEISSYLQILCKISICSYERAGWLGDRDLGFSNRDLSRDLCSDTALRVIDAKIGPKVKIFVFRYVCFVSRIWRQNSSPGSLAFSYLGNRAKISHMNPRQNSSR